MNSNEESDLRGRLAEAESLGDAMRNNEIDAIVSNENILVLRMLELGQEQSQIIDNLPDVIFKLDKQGRFLYASPALSIYTPFSPSEILQRPFGDFGLTSELVQQFQKEFDAALHSGKNREFVFSTETRQGHRHLMARLFPEAGAAHEISYVLGIVLDISQQHSASLDLKRSEARWRTAIEGANLGTFEYDPETGEFIHWNARMAELYGFEELAEVNTADAFERIHPEDLDALHQILVEAAEQKHFEFEHRVHDDTGEIRWINLSGRQVDADSRNNALIIGIASDITARKTVETSLQLAVDIADESNRLKSEFIASMSHEVRTPLTGILGFADILSAQQDPEVIKEGVDSIRENGKLLISIINNVLDLSKLEAGKTRIHLTDCDPRKIIDQAIALMQGAARKKNLHLGFECAPDIPSSLQTDPERLKQILINLLSNAIKFTKEGHVKMTVSFDKAHATLRIDVTDTGPGIDPNFQEKLFIPFEQEDEQNDANEPGTGLGLAISRQLSHALSGELTLTKSDKNGSTFTLLLALDGDHKKTQANDKSAKASNTRAETPDRNLLAKINVLVVEDRKVLRSMLAHSLQQYGCNPKIVANGEAALECIRSKAEQPDAVLLDMRLPGIDGIEVARQMRAMGFQKSIIALTAHAGSIKEAQCLEAGCTAFLLKPFRQEELVALLLDQTGQA